MRYVHGDEPAELYGRWNAVVAFRDDEVLAWSRAHDGDFFPETVFDYVDAIRRAECSLAAMRPVRIDIDITQACNADCVFCFSRPYQVLGYSGARTSSEELARLFADLGALGARTVRFCGGGDPLVHPEIRKLLPLAHSYNLKLCVITAGDYLDKDLAALLLDHTDNLHWSVNAASDITRIELHRPRPGANTLSETGALLRAMLCERGRRGCRLPLVWATFLVMPRNVGEVVAAAEFLYDVGVDSVSFRPVYHGLGGTWSPAGLTELESTLRQVARLQRPGFRVFTPKRSVVESGKLRPSAEFAACVSRRLRTVLESTTGGLALQSCGMYRGTGARGGLVVDHCATFGAVWDQFTTRPQPASAPDDCAGCIDVSVNRTLNFIVGVLREHSLARFVRADIGRNEEWNRHRER